MLVSMVSLPMGCMGREVGEESRKGRSEGLGGGGGRARILGTYDQTR